MKHDAPYGASAEIRAEAERRATVHANRMAACLRGKYQLQVDAAQFTRPAADRFVKDQADG